MRNTGMSKDEFDVAAQDQGTPQQRRRFTIAMLEIILRRPGTVSPDLLRML